jgi:hypothetical protein
VTVPKPYFIASMFDVHQDDTAWNNFKANAFQLIVEMKGKLKSWELFGAISSFTDLPNSVLHLWRVGKETDLVEGTRYFEDNQPLFDELMAVCEAPSVQLLARMPYDPSFQPGGSSTECPSKDGRFYFLWVELTLLPGAKPRRTFVKACHGLLKKMETDLKTWKLLAAGSAVTGRPNTVMHLWQLDDANALLDGMNWFGENNPDYVALATSCQRQRQQLFTSMLYNPLGENGALSSDDQKHKKRFATILSKRGMKHG